MLKFTRNSFCTRAVREPRFFGAAIVLVVVALLVVPGGAFAQGGPGGGGRPGGGAVSIPRDPPVEAEPRFDLRFEGGTVADYLEAIQEASGKRNIVAMAGTDTVPMPRVALDNVNTQAAVSVLNGLGVEDKDGSRRSISFFTQFDVVTVSVSVQRERSMMRPAAVSMPVSRSTVVHGLAEMLLNGGYTIDAILSAIDVALDMSGDSDAKLRYHEETRMLFVHGTGAEHATVRNVLEELSLQATMMPREEVSEEDRLRHEMMALEGQMEGELQSLRGWSGHSRPMLDERISIIRNEIASLEEQIGAGEGTIATNEEIALQYRALERLMIQLERVDTLIRDGQSRLEQMRERRNALQKKLSGEAGS